MIEYTVGQGAKNETRDVSWIQGRLNLCQKQIEVIVTGKWDSRTEAATEYIQGRYLGMSPTGKIFPNDATAILLERSGKECMAPLDTARLPPVGSGAKISQDDFEAASKNCELTLLLSAR